jgi:hypothetical protein
MMDEMLPFKHVSFPLLDLPRELRDIVLDLHTDDIGISFSLGTSYDTVTESVDYSKPHVKREAPPLSFSNKQLQHEYVERLKHRTRIRPIPFHLHVLTLGIGPHLLVPQLPTQYMRDVRITVALEQISNSSQRTKLSGIIAALSKAQSIQIEVSSSFSSVQRTHDMERALTALWNHLERVLRGNDGTPFKDGVEDLSDLAFPAFEEMTIIGKCVHSLEKMRKTVSKDDSSGRRYFDNGQTDSGFTFGGREVWWSEVGNIDLRDA